jgi:hypothetical protein
MNDNLIRLNNFLFSHHKNCRIKVVKSMFSSKNLETQLLKMKIMKENELTKIKYALL